MRTGGLWKGAVQELEEALRALKDGYIHVVDCFAAERLSTKGVLKIRALFGYITDILYKRLHSSCPREGDSTLQYCLPRSRAPYHPAQDIDRVKNPR